MKKEEKAVKAMHETIVGGKPWDELSHRTQMGYFTMLNAALGALNEEPADTIIPIERVKELIAASRGGVRLSIDGNAACALLGTDEKEGEAEFVIIDESEFNDNYERAARRAVTRALKKLTARCYPNGDYSLPYYTGDLPWSD